MISDIRICFASQIKYLREICFNICSPQLDGSQQFLTLVQLSSLRIFVIVITSIAIIETQQHGKHYLETRTQKQSENLKVLVSDRLRGVVVKDAVTNKLFEFH